MNNRPSANLLSRLALASRETSRALSVLYGWAIVGLLLMLAFAVAANMWLEASQKANDIALRVAICLVGLVIGVTPWWLGYRKISRLIAKSIEIQLSKEELEMAQLLYLKYGNRLQHKDQIQSPRVQEFISAQDWKNLRIRYEAELNETRYDN
jgi:hypothetical protein